jgi:phosphoribosylanthranilate isomerase
VKLRIKLCGVRTVADARLCADAGADELGIIFAPKSKRRISLLQAQEIRAAVPSSLPLIGVFQDASLDELAEAAQAVSLSALQLHGSLPPALLAAPRDPSALPRALHGLPIYAALQVTDRPSLARISALGLVQRILLDGPRGGSGISFAWSLAREARALAPAKCELFVAGGLDSANVAQAIRESNPDGVDVASGIEGADGLKDPARISAFIAAARLCTH